MTALLSSPLLDGPLPHAGTDTSAAAAKNMKAKAPLLREQVRTAVASHPEGMTCDEAEIALGLSHQTCSARLNELVARSDIVDSGNRRPTRSGRKAIVYVARE